MFPRINGAKLVSTIAILLFARPLAMGQHSAPAAPRKILVRVMAGYPTLARRTNMIGAVKIEALVTPDGVVRATQVIGGNPILADAAVQAVRHWKFAPGPHETREEVVLQFSPN